jgi:acetyl-CoA carboxylase carboxyl transferase subunit beta
MQQFSIYSPVSLNHTLGGPYHDPLLDREAAVALMLTAPDCLALGIIDAVVPEPPNGAQSDPKEAALALQVSVMKEFAQLSRLSQGKLLKQRYKKFRKMGELSPYSLEAMNQEVELLMHISSDPRRRRRVIRGAKPSHPEEPATEARAAASDQATA